VDHDPSSYDVLTYAEPPLFLGSNMTEFLRGDLTIEYLHEQESKVIDWLSELRRPDISHEQHGEIRGGINAMAEAFPESDLWDTLRGAAAGIAYGANSVDVAFDFVADIRVKSEAAATLTEFVLEDTSPETATSLLRAYLARYDRIDDPIERNESYQAIINELIAGNPFHEAINLLETDLLQRQPDYDLQTEWAKAAGIPETNINRMLDDYNLWDGMPSALRRHLYEQHVADHNIIMQEVSSEFLLYLAEKFQRGQQAYPQAAVWDFFRYTHAKSLLERGYPSFALDIARTVHDDFSKYNLITMFTPHYEEEAIELAGTIHHAELREDVLQTGPWNKPEEASKVVTQKRASVAALAHKLIAAVDSTQQP
jgi:hypothetical protein